MLANAAGPLTTGAKDHASSKNCSGRSLPGSGEANLAAGEHVTASAVLPPMALPEKLGERGRLLGVGDCDSDAALSASTRAA